MCERPPFSSITVAPSSAGKFNSERGVSCATTVKVPTIWEDIDGFDGSKPDGPYRFKPTVDEKTLGENGMLFYWREGASEKERNKIMKVMVVTPPAIEITGLSRGPNIEVTLIMREMEKGKEVERSREDITIFESQFANYPIPPGSAGVTAMVQMPETGP